MKVTKNKATLETIYEGRPEELREYFQKEKNNEKKTGIQILNQMKKEREEARKRSPNRRNAQWTFAETEALKKYIREGRGGIKSKCRAAARKLGRTPAATYAKAWQKGYC